MGIEGLLGALNPYVAVASGVGSLANGVIGGITAYQAAKAQQRAADKAGSQITGSYNKAQGYQQPYYDTGTQNMQTMSQMVNEGKFNATPYSYQMGQAPQDQFNFQADPGYAFRQQQGQQAVEGSAAAKGMGLSGASLKALQRYGQNFASNEYQNAFNRFGNQRDFNQNQYATNTQLGMGNELNRYNAANQQGQQQYGRYNDLANMGQTASTNLANLATNYGSQMGNLAVGKGNAQAAGIMGVGQAVGNTLSNMGGMLTLGQILGQSSAYGGAGTAQNAFDKTPYGKAYNQAGY